MLVVGLIGVALGVTGGAQAADLITGKQIKDGTVTGRDVRDGTVLSTDVANGSLTPDDYAGVTIGPPGAPGEPGTRGPDSLGSVYVVRSTTEAVRPSTIGTAVADCDPGDVAIGGGLGGEPGRHGRQLDSAPLGTDAVRRASWVVRAYNGTSIDIRVTAFALCAEVQP
jgi:hypothetical protein